MAVTFHCRSCGAAYPWSAAVWRCACGGLLDAQEPDRFDPASVETGDPTLWRYRHALPAAEPVSLGEGWTPLLSDRLAGREVYLKLDYLMPTGSFKDRGASVQVARLVEAGVERVVEDSSGNAGGALAAYCARAGIGCGIYCPAATSPHKTRLMEAVGARVIRVPGPRQAAAEAVRAVTETTFYASHGWDPAYRVGTATAAYEIAEQLAWLAPDSVVAPVGNGTLILGLAAGFARLRRDGVVGSVPRLYAVQAEACAPLAEAWRIGGDEPAAVTPAPTIAEGIAVARPARGTRILAAIRGTAGRVLSVGESSIRQALSELHGRGWYVEPTSAVALAGAAVLGGELGRTAVVVLTGSGMKSGESVRDERR